MPKADELTDYLVSFEQESQPRIDAAIVGCFTRRHFYTPARHAPAVITLDKTMGKELTVPDSTPAPTRVSLGGPRIKALMLGFYGVRNLGDELMLHCLRQWLEPQGVELTILAENPAEIQRLHRLPALANVPLLGEWNIYDSWVRGSGWKLAAYLRKFDMIIGGGGDCIRDDRSNRQFLYSVEKFVIASLMGKQICLLNVGLGRLRRGYAKRVLAWILRRSMKTIVRDQRSVEVCRALGATNVHYAPDVVSLLPRQLNIDTARPAGNGEPPYLLVCLRDASNDYGRYAMPESRLANFATALDGIMTRHNLRVRFLPFQDCPGSTNDNHMHEEVFRRMQRRDSAQILDWSDDFRALGEAFAGARGVIAMRLHAAILAGAFQRPCVIMPYDQKLLEFGQQAGIGDYLPAEMLDSTERSTALLEQWLGPHPCPAPLPPPERWESLRLR
jgi:polysaccharide pyruvyl transferase CsaB